jgi:hypothetical protein
LFAVSKSQHTANTDTSITDNLYKYTFPSNHKAQDFEAAFRCVELRVRVALTFPKDDTDSFMQRLVTIQAWCFCTY